jgi:hypothetical protein
MKNSSYARGHKETSTTGKWDPGGYSLDTMRSDLNKKLNPPPKPPSVPIYVEEEMPALLISDGPGPSNTVYAAPMDLSSKVAVTKTTYDKLTACHLVQYLDPAKKPTWDGKSPYMRIDIDAADLNRIPTIDATKKPYGGPA